jgi:hypothetical protein
MSGVQHNLTYKMSHLEYSRMRSSVDNVIDQLEGTMPKYPSDSNEEPIETLKEVRATLRKIATR